MKVNDHFKDTLTRPVLPSKYGIKNNGTLISMTNLNTWLSECKRSESPVYFPAGTYLLPPDFEFNFGNTDLLIVGDGPDKTILTTNNGPASNFAIPEKINLTKQKPAKDAVYQVDIISYSLHPDFASLTGITLDSYVNIVKGILLPITLAEVKKLGYVTELDATGPDPGIDGLYVVSKHASHDYGGGFKHLKLGYNGAPLYVQGTVLQRKEGIWSRFYSSVAFICDGNFSVKNVCFSNFMPYLFLPAGNNSPSSKKKKDHFIIEYCRFEQTARILATMNYGGISETSNWYKASNWYPITTELSFKDFTIKKCEFSYIHESIVWGAPPSMFYNILNNNIHDCYTILNCFYLFPQTNSSLPTKNNSHFIINENTFLRVRPLNPGSENSVHLIRTKSKGAITHNTFIDCTGVHLYLSAATKVKSNTIKTYMSNIPSAQLRPPLILVKVAKNEMITFYENDFSMGMMGNLVANESQASFTFKNNKLIGTTVRYITPLTVRDLTLDTYRTYTIIDSVAFVNSAGIGNYDTSIRFSNTVYYNKRRSRWEAMPMMPMMYLYSEVDHFNHTEQSIQFTNNEIETGYLTRIQKKVFTKFKSVVFENNLIQNCMGLLAGNDSTVIESFRFIRNTIKNGSLQMTSLGNVSTSVSDLNISGNTFYFDLPGFCSLAASESLKFEDNVYIKNDSLNTNAFTGLPEPDYSIYLKGYKGQQMFIRGNRFIAEMAKVGIIQISNPDKVTIKHNSFDLSIPARHSGMVTIRHAINFKTTEPVSCIRIFRNTYLPQSNKENYLVSFDTSYSTILNFINKSNRVLENESAVTKTVLATNKYFKNYVNRKNLFADKETILSVTNKINSSK